MLGGVLIYIYVYTHMACVYILLWHGFQGHGLMFAYYEDYPSPYFQIRIITYVQIGSDEYIALTTS